MTFSCHFNLFRKTHFPKNSIQRLVPPWLQKKNNKGVWDQKFSFFLMIDLCCSIFHVESYLPW